MNEFDVDYDYLTPSVQKTQTELNQQEGVIDAFGTLTAEAYAIPHEEIAAPPSVTVGEVIEPVLQTFSEQLDFSETVFETNASREEDVTPEELVPAEAVAVPVGNNAEVFPFHLCDEELLQELGKIPDRLAFKIGDVAEMAQVKTYVLRYWETEFDVLSPKKSKNNQRMYSRRDVENVFLIKKLLYRDRFSIEGARSAMRQLKTEIKKERKVIQNHGRFRDNIQRMHELIQDIQALRGMFTART